MCNPVIAVAATAATVVGQMAQHSDQVGASVNAESARRQNELNQKIYRRQVEEHNNEVYAQDVKYAQDVFAYQRGEFARQQQWFDDSVGLIKQDYVNQLGTLMTRAVEESVADQLQGQDAIREGRRLTAQGQVAAAERGVSGNTVKTLIGDIDRQVGEALTSHDMNRVSVERQLQLEALGLKARADTAINQLPLQTFQPIQAPRAPAPTNPVSPTAPITPPSSIGGFANTVSAGIGAYYGVRGMAPNVGSSAAPTASSYPRSSYTVNKPVGTI